MRWAHTLIALLPALAMLALIWGAWGEIEAIALHVPPLILIGLALLTLLPLGVQLAIWSAAARLRPPHPFTAVLPIALFSVVLLWLPGEQVARRIPALCEVTAYDKVVTDRPDNYGSKAYFSITVSGWGNPSSFEFTSVLVVYTGPRRFDDLYVQLPQWQAHFTNSYTTHFPLTRESVLEYVRSSDDFSPEEADAIADRIWVLLQKYAEKQDLPPMAYHPEPPFPTLSYRVPRSNNYFGAVLLGAPLLFVLSWLLAVWYCSVVRREIVR